jgi:hypothetical protein
MPEARIAVSNKTLVIKKIVLFKFKIACAGLKVASLGVSDGVQTGTGRYQTEFGR